MTHDSPLKPPASRRDELDFVVPRSESFVAFDRWIDAQLEGLVARWAHTAAPNAAKRAARIERRWGR